MKIPKYVDEALRMRTKAACQFSKYDYIISNWLSKNSFDDCIDSSDFHGGVESIMNPQDSEDRIREAILKR